MRIIDLWVRKFIVLPKIMYMNEMPKFCKYFLVKNSKMIAGTVV